MKCCCKGVASGSKRTARDFADAIISIEYIDTAMHAPQADETVLHLAEESLAALGFASEFSQAA